MFRRLSAFCIPMLLLLWLLTGEMQAQVPGCSTVDCDPPANTYETTFLYPVGAPGCRLIVYIQVRECAGRREVRFDRVESFSNCCDGAFAGLDVEVLVRDIRDYVFTNFGTIAGNAAVNRVVHPSCWTKNNTTGIAEACADNMCCYIQGPPGTPGAAVLIGGPAPIPPCATALCTFICP